MDKKLFDLVEAQTPKMNPIVVNGVAVDQMRLVEDHIHRIFKTAAADFPPELQYAGYRRCTPQEEFNELTKKQNAQTAYELAPSDMYMVKYLFTFQGEELEPRYIYLPFVNDAGIIRIRGSQFQIAPVLADKAISIGPDFIFIPLNRDKLTFQRQTQHFYRNGERETVFVVWSEIYHLKAKDKKLVSKAAVRGQTSLVHYLFAKYGVHQTFAVFANTNIEVGDEKTITPEAYPADKWVICSSTAMKPRGVKERMYVASDLRVAVPLENYDQTVKSLIGGLFYIVDHFPQRVLPEYIGQEGEERLWRVLMGHLLWGGGGNEGLLADNVEAHLRSLDGYLDKEAKDYLRDDDIYCEDLYQLFMYIIENFSPMVTQSMSQVASMYDKRLMVLRYVLKDLTNAINKFMFRVTSFKPRTRPLTKNDVVQMMRHTLKPTLVMGINRGHGEVASVASPGDNKYFKFTSRLVLQVDSSGTKSKSKATSSDPSKFLHSSIAEVASFNTMTKSEPTGRDKINPFVHVSPDGLIVRDPAKVELLDSVQRKIQR